MKIFFMAFLAKISVVFAINWHKKGDNATLAAIFLAIIDPMNPPLPLPAPSPLVENLPDMASALLPLLLATAQAIQSQDGSQATLSCVLITDAVPSATLAELQQSLNRHFSPSEYYSLSAFRDMGFQRRYDLAVIALEPGASIEAVADIVVNCRDLAARHVLVIAPASQSLTAFGFAKLPALGTGQRLEIAAVAYTAWQFNLFDYKQLPDWFNSRFWANPENWNKFRW